jgi:hypothetical protein
VNSGDSVTVICRGTPAVRRQWYGELARLIASAPRGTAALFEGSLGDPAPRVTVRPAELVTALQGSPAGATVRLEPRPGCAPAPPGPLDEERWGDVVRTDPTRSRSFGLGSEAIDRIGFASAAGPKAWLGLQTFWLPAHHGTVWLARRFRFAARARSELDRRFGALGTAVAAEWSLSIGLPATYRTGSFRARRDWRRGGMGAIPPEAWFERPSPVAARSVTTVDRGGAAAEERPVETPAIVFGASGAGKTTYLARWAAEVANRGEPLVVVDLHGDLAPAIVGRLGAEARRRVVATDATVAPVAGVAALSSAGRTDRAAAHLVAALKRLSPDGTDLYWGFRLERIFDTFVRLALESGGSITDVYDLLTNPDRRDAARLATRSGELARFLDELAPVVRRNPEFLWSAATRLSKVVLVPSLRELLAPEDGGLPVEELLDDGRLLLVRLPFASLGPEAATFAATLVLGRVYLGLAARAERAGPPVRTSLVLDEVHAFSPRLVSEILTEGRKFGLRTVVATQYPERLATEVRAAARGALRGFVSFRVPRAAAADVGVWFGLSPTEAVDRLPNLPTGHGLLLDPYWDGVRPTTLEPDLPTPDPRAWADAVDATREEFEVRATEVVDVREADAATERLLLAVLAGAESGAVVRREEVVANARALPGPAPDASILSDRLTTILRDGYVEQVREELRLTPAGERRLGLTTPTGATRETAEHRSLLMAAFRVFARRGYRLEILRQGRFDTTLPDARLRQLAPPLGSPAPIDLARDIEHARSGWAWRFFAGRDVFVEAEVSGALRPERVRHGVRKALSRGAFVLFVVGDAHRAHRVRSVVRAMGLGPDRAQVWTLHLTGRPVAIRADKPLSVHGRSVRRCERS